MKTRKKLVVHGKKTDFQVSVGYANSDYAVAWFWNTPGQDAKKNAREYVKWKNETSM